jgi:energy-coupling factor transporter ATP-binding protein EcfA2
MTEVARDPEAAPERAPRPRLTKLVIHRYRNVRPGTTLRFDDTWNLLLGKNGTGKTTLLRLLEGILSGDLRAFGDHAVHVDYEMSVGEASIAGTLKWNCGTWAPPRHRVDDHVGDDGPLLPLDIELSGRYGAPNAPSLTWRYAAPSTVFETWVDGALVEAPRGQPLGFYLAPLPFAAWYRSGSSVSRALRPTGFWRLRSVRRFDEGLDAFALLFGWNARLSAVEGKINGAEIATGIPEFPADLGMRLTGLAVDEIQTSQRASWSADEDAVLAEFEASTEVGHASLELPLLRVDVSGDEKIIDVGPCRLRVTRPDGTLFFHDDLSFGQKRLLAFLYMMRAETPIVLADEISNGMHRAWIDLAVEKMRTRQNFIAAQNPILLDRIGFESAGQMQRSLIFCREENGKLVWENAPVDEMRDVYRAYDVGLQHVSDLLWQKGLW